MSEALFKLKIKDIMKENPVTVLEKENVTEVVAKMKENDIGAVLVLKDSGKLSGIFSERDVYSRVVAERKDYDKTKVSEVMTVNPRTLTSDTFISDAFKLTQDGKFRHVPVIDVGVLKGIISARDINRAFYYEREVLSEMKNKFTITTSHELKTPTAIIMGCMQLLRRDRSNLKEEQINLLDIIDRNVKRLNEILVNLKKLYLGIYSSFEDRLTVSSIESVIHYAVEEVKEFVKKRNQNIILDVDEKIPQIRMDKNSIRQALLNLLLNSIRFTPDGGTIVIRAKDNGNDIRVEVEDNGIGIPSDRLDRIFESFYEVQDTDRHSSGNIEFLSSGMGIGLTIVKNIVDAHKGRIWVESELDKFSKVTFTIPK